MAGIKVVFGGAGVNPGKDFGVIETLNSAFDELEKGGCSNIDTAALYGESETILGQANAGKRFTIDTKTRGGFNAEKKGGSSEKIAQEAASSQEKLKTTVDVYYIHAPDHDTPIEETVEAINAVHQKGFFKRFGLSNYKAEDVQKIHDLCKAKGFVVPSVYQGNYSPIARKQEEVLFPTLRKLGISFYAYSPLAGGFLTKTRQQVQDGAGRFDKSTSLGQLYAGLYAKESYLNALAQWEDIANEEGCTKADLAYRWVKYNSPLSPDHGDAIIIGASNLKQLQETLGSVNKGPLSDKAAKRIDQLWETISHEAPLDNFHL